MTFLKKLSSARVCSLALSYPAKTWVSEIPYYKSDGQEKSTKILISWQELKNQFLSFFCSLDCSRQKLYICEKNYKIGFRCRSLRLPLLFTLKFANINFPCVCKRSRMEEFEHFPWTEKFFFFHQKILSGQQQSLSYWNNSKMRDRFWG